MLRIFDREGEGDHENFKIVSVIYPDAVSDIPVKINFIFVYLSLNNSHIYVMSFDIFYLYGSRFVLYHSSFIHFLCIHF